MRNVPRLARGRRGAWRTSPRASSTDLIYWHRALTPPAVSPGAADRTGRGLGVSEPIALRSSAPPTVVRARGTTVGRYVIIDTLGQGGMGVVYAAYDTQLDRKIAIKVLRPEFLRGEGTAEIEARLLREAQAMARLNHPNVASPCTTSGPTRGVSSSRWSSSTASR